VDLTARVIRLRPEEAKNGSGRTIALEGELWDLIQRRYSARLLPTKLDRIKMATLVFHHNGGKQVIRMDIAWKAACRAAGCSAISTTSAARLRNMIRAGVPQAVAMAISGHKTSSMFQRYNITSEDDLRQAAQRVQLYVDGLPTEAKR